MEPYLLSDKHAEAAGSLLAAAFFPAAAAAFVYPDPARRARVHPAFFTAMTRLVVGHGQALGRGDPLDAVALWLSPDSAPTEARSLRRGWRQRGR